MKTLQLSIFTGTGIAAVISFALIVVIIPSSLADQAGLTIGTEQNKVGVGEPISFFVEISNPLQDSIFPVAVIVNEQNQTVWHDDDLPPNGYKGIAKVYYVSRDSDNVPVINQTGKYTLVVTFADKKVSKDLIVTETIRENNMLHYYGVYKGIDKENTSVKIANQVYYLTTIHKTPSDMIASNDTTVKFNGVAFTFPGCGQCLPMPTVQNPPYYVNVQFSDKTNETLEIRNNQWSTIGSPIDSHEYFSNGTKIFPNGTSGTWAPRFYMDPIVTILSNHEHPHAGITVTHDSMKFLVSTDVLSKDKPVQNENQVDSPLKQFKSGIPATDVKCKDGFELIIKAADNSPACVRPNDIPVLYLREWVGFAKGDLLYLIPQNSEGKIVVKYNPRATLNEIHLNSRIYDGKTGYRASPSIIQVIADQRSIPAGKETSVTYAVTSHDTKGTYWLDLGTCQFIPIVVGLDISQITDSDLDNVMTGWKCPSIIDKFHATSLDGIVLKWR